MWTQLFGTGGVIGPGVKREVMAVGSGEDLGGVPRDLIVRSAAAIP